MQSGRFIETVPERCRVCYTCVRECPAKAIRIANGQAEILPERCIGCGNCVRVCSQDAKQVVSSIPQVRQLLDSGAKVAACLAPSFPAEFVDLGPFRVVGMLRKLGFGLVAEVAFGADLVADRYRRLLNARDGRRYISTPCPAVVAYVERYHPDLVPNLAPIVSPAVAISRCLKRLHGPDLRIVFIGPCVSKKQEAASPHVPGEIDAVLTFQELRSLLETEGVTPDQVQDSDFDPPHSGLGALFPISRGLLQAADLREDLMAGQIITADGRQDFVEAIKEFASGAFEAKLLEILCCNGCIMGPGMSAPLPLYARRARVSEFVRQRAESIDPREFRQTLESFDDLDLTRRYSPDDQRIPAPSDHDIGEILARMGKFAPEEELNCGACGYDSCREHAIAIYKGLAESEMCLPYTIDQLRRTIKELAVSNEQLASVQEALMHSEKLASMGQLAAGIAHEINNPLGVVLMYSHLLLDEANADHRLKDDLSMIVDQADRCKKIVQGLLHFARQNKVVLQPTDVTELVDRSLRTVPPPENIMVWSEHELDDPTAELDRDQVIQVLTNLITNAYAAMPNGGTLRIVTRGDADKVSVAVTDTGVGIAKDRLSKIFEPFYTTKQIGKGTGLGLAVAYGVIKMHRGDITVESNADPADGPTGTTFTVILPRKGQQE